jgi:thiamine-monophosphate kinase
MDERALVRRIKRLSAGQAPGVILGIGDDAAVFRPSEGEDLVFTTDMLVEGVHFELQTHRPSDVGHKALARGLSDVAAMGAAPRFCLVSLALSPSCGERWVDGFYRGLMGLARSTGTALIGGDLSHSDKVTCDVVACGAVPRGQALRRGGARAGDLIFVSGMLGGSALGLNCRKGAAWRRHLRPEPRLALGSLLREALRATAAMDLSDGVSLDLRRLCEESGVAAELDGTLPIFPGATVAQALHGGEDYELLFTVSPETVVPAEFGGLALNCIGRMVPGAPGSVSWAGQPLAALGYDHFRK